MKKEYKEMQMEIIKFTVDYIITTSGDLGDGDDYEGFEF